jgi:hypothetical protein
MRFSNAAEGNVAEGKGVSDCLAGEGNVAEGKRASDCLAGERKKTNRCSAGT